MSKFQATSGRISCITCGKESPFGNFFNYGNGGYYECTDCLNNLEKRIHARRNKPVKPFSKIKLTLNKSNRITIRNKNRI